MIFDANDHAALTTLFALRSDGAPVYAGYKPNVAEAPNGDTRECRDCGGEGAYQSWPNLPTHTCPACAGTGRVPNVAPPTTRYLHVAPKYAPPPWAMAYLARAHYEACRVAEALGVPATYYPRVADGTLRVLDYDVGGSQPEHTDFDLFTIVLYRSTLADLERRQDARVRGLAEAEVISPGLHIGELGELVGLGPATPHRVPARPYAQQSIVYFAMPDHAARLPCPSSAKRAESGEPGDTVGTWLAARIARSRVYR